MLEVETSRLHVVPEDADVLEPGPTEGPGPARQYPTVPDDIDPEPAAEIAEELDEADQLADPDVIYHLHSLSQFTVILIANREADLFGPVDDRLVSRLRASEHVHLEQYHDHQLVDILAARVRWGLEPESITTGQLERIADAAAGDARLAIGILRTVASTAERNGADTITDEGLLDAAEDARAEHKQKTLESLTPHQRVIHDIVRNHGPLAPSDIHTRYQSEVDDPRTQRTVRTYLSKLERYNILKAWGTSHDRKYAVAEAAAPTPAD